MRRQKAFTRDEQGSVSLEWLVLVGLVSLSGLGAIQAMAEVTRGADLARSGIASAPLQIDGATSEAAGVAPGPEQVL